MAREYSRAPNTKSVWARAKSSAIVSNNCSSVCTYSRVRLAPQLRYESLYRRCAADRCCVGNVVANDSQVGVTDPARSLTMRELTKSLFSFSWIMSLFGGQQTVNLIDPAKATRAFDEVTEAATKEFHGLTKAMFQTGDRLQRQMVDAAFCVFSPNALDP